MKRAFSLWAPVLAWAALIYFLSSIPDLSSGLDQDLFLRKLAHLLEYAVLAALFWRALAGVRRVFLLSFALSVLYAASDEAHQAFVPGRYAALHDVLIDAAGALVALLILKKRSSHEDPDRLPVVRDTEAV